MLPLVAFYFSQVGYATAYGGNTLNRSGYSEQYANGVYVYRILGRALVLDLYDLSGQTFKRILGSRPEWFSAIIPKFDPGMWAAHLVVNGASFLVMCIILFRLLVGQLQERGVIVYLVLVVTVLASGWIITPYDFLGYALLVAAIACFHWNSRLAIPLCPLLVFAGTLNRESQAVAVSYIFVAVLMRSPATRNRDIIMLCVSASALVGAYIGVHLALGGGGGVVNSLTLWRQGVISAVGLVLFGLSAWLNHQASAYACGQRAEGVAALSAVAMSPYIFGIIAGGFYVEYRIFVPILIVESLLVSLVTMAAPASFACRINNAWQKTSLYSAKGTTPAASCSSPPSRSGSS